MIVLVHNFKIVTSILDEALQPIEITVLNKTILETLKNIASQYPEILVVWCHETLVKGLNIEAFSKVFHHKRILAFYNPKAQDYLPKQIGYVERSFYLKINKNVTFPTWITSSLVGGINTVVLNTLKPHLNYNVSFDYFLIALAKRTMIEGLFCYSEPRLIKNNTFLQIEMPKATKQELFKFVKQHYKWVWIVFLTWSYAIYERKTTIFSLFRSLFYKQLNQELDLETIDIKSSRQQIELKTIDVIIPTIGRKQHLYNVLKDLTKQTHLPKNVIIVEQNTQQNSVSELDYLTTQNWPFSIKHEFTHQSGVCNARNIALSKVESEWAFLADDDIRFDFDFFETSLSIIKKNGISVLNYLCLQPHQKQTYFKMHQTSIFGSGSSLVKSSIIKNLQFNTAYEFGFGEDSEFGMQLRNKGEDVVFIPNLKITHLKVPIGGYRTKIKQLWEAENIQTKPSPTVQLLYQTYYTKQQLEGYKLLLFLKQFKALGYKNPIKFIEQFPKQWNQSVLWSNRIKQNSNA